MVTLRGDIDTRVWQGSDIDYVSSSAARQVRIMSTHYRRWVLASPMDIRQLDKIYGRLCRQRDSAPFSEVNSVLTVVDKLAVLYCLIASFERARKREPCTQHNTHSIQRSLIGYFNNAR